MMSRKGGSIAGISWADVAARMGHKRNGQQCRNKWYSVPSPVFLIYRAKILIDILWAPRVQSLHSRDEYSRSDWSAVDTYIFMNK